MLFTAGVVVKPKAESRMNSPGQIRAAKEEQSPQDVIKSFLRPTIKLCRIFKVFKRVMLGVKLDLEQREND